MATKIEASRELIPAKTHSGALAVYGRIADPIAAIEKLGQFYHQSGMLGVKTPGAGAVLALSCMCDGITPLEFKRTYHIMHDGNVSMRADAMLSEFRSRGGKYKILARTPERAEIELSYEGNTEKFAITIEDAKAERYYWSKDRKTPKDNWSTPRSVMQMLWARVVSDGVRTVCPEAVAGTYAPEELENIRGDVVEAEYSVVSTPVEQEAQSQPAEPQVQTQPEPGPTVFTEPVDEPPFEANGQDVVDPDEQPCNVDQLKRIIALGGQLNQSKAQIAESLVAAYKVAKPQDLTVGQAEDAIMRLEAAVEKESRSAAATA